MNKKNVDTLIEMYIEKFGGYPYFILMGADDDYVSELIEKALKDGKEIEFDYEEGASY